MGRQVSRWSKHIGSINRGVIGRASLQVRKCRDRAISYQPWVPRAR
jgi:hypothetical protein